MPVVINEFEVVTEPAGTGAARSAPAPAPQAQEPPDIERLMSMQHARDRRVRAY